MSAPRESLTPDGWPRASGYSHGVAATGRVVVTAGQIGWDPVTMHFATDDFAAQCAQAFRNVMAVLHAAGAGAEHLVRLTWYVTSRAEYVSSLREVGESYREIVGRHFPAMAVIIVSGLVEPRAKVEIEATAVIPE
jgi:enamine deaminase RidA (YjgF/YER057c/UK114 family)